MSRNQLQLLGCVCLWIADKYEESDCLSVHEFVEMSNQKYTIKEVGTYCLLDKLSPVSVKWICLDECHGETSVGGTRVSTDSNHGLSLPDMLDAGHGTSR